MVTVTEGMLPAVLGHRKGGCGGRDGVSAGGYSHG